MSDRQTESFITDTAAGLSVHTPSAWSKGEEEEGGRADFQLGSQGSSPLPDYDFWPVGGREIENLVAFPSPLGP